MNPLRGRIPRYGMRILFYLGHPAHFHLFKFAIKQLKENGYTIEVAIKTKDILEDLLANEKLDYVNILPEGRKDNKLFILLGLLRRTWRLSKFVFRNRVDMLVGSEPSLAHVGKLFGIPSLIFVEDDTDVIPYFARSTYPLTNDIVSPESCDLGRWTHKKISYKGYQKLAYLHPNTFHPNGKSFNNINGNGRKTFLIRTAKLAAHHDFGINGINKEILSKLINLLSCAGDVYISSEQELDQEFQDYQIDIDISDMHHFLAHCDMLIGDSQSMAVEAAMLGIPSIRFSDFAGKIGVLEELENRYGLTYGLKTSEPQNMFAKVEDLLTIPNLKEEWQERRKRMLSDKIDVTAFIVWLIENYPESKRIMRENPDYQSRFK